MVLKRFAEGLGSLCKPRLQATGFRKRMEKPDPTGDVAPTLRSSLDVKTAVDRRRCGMRSATIQNPVDHYHNDVTRRSLAHRLLKIDRSFIVGLGQDTDGASKDAEIVPAMIDLTHALGLKAVAEGVETTGQLAQLQAMGCDLAQGNYFSEPLPGEELSVLLEELTS